MPTPPILPQSFWDAEMRRLAMILVPRLTQMALQGAQAGTDKIGIGFNFNIYSLLAEHWARDYTDALLKEVHTTNLQVVGQALADWIATPNRTVGDLRAALTPWFGVQRADVIAVTETTRAMAAGELLAYQRGGVEEIRWGTNRDELVCPLCGPLHGEVRKIGEPFGYFKWRKNTEPQAVFAPPYHPNCRCGIVPVVRLRRGAFGDVPNSLIVANVLAMIRPAYVVMGELNKHDGPGPHENGSPQDVHGGADSSNLKEKDYNFRMRQDDIDRKLQDYKQSAVEIALKAPKTKPPAKLQAYIDSAYALGEKAKQMGVNSMNEAYRNNELFSSLERFDLPENVAFDAAINGKPKPYWVNGWRYGEIPTSGSSKNFTEGIMESGVSVIATDNGLATEGIGFEMFTKVKTKIYLSGFLNTKKTGSDGEPLLLWAKKTGDLS